MLNLYKNLLPKGRAWDITVVKQLREFFDGLTTLPEDVKTFDDEIWLDIFPETTRELDAWESQFGLMDTGLTTQERRDRLAAEWADRGGQTLAYIEGILQASGFDVYLHQWWETGSDPPVPRDPRLYVEDGVPGGVFTEGALCGNPVAICGEPASFCGASLEPTGSLLVNKQLIQKETVTCGDPAVICGAPTAICGGKDANYTEEVFIITGDVDTWSYFLYIGGQTFGTNVNIPASRQNEFENLCKQLCPGQHWLGLLVNYV